MLRQLGVKSKIAMVHVFVCDIGDDDDENFQVERDLALDISALDCSAPQVQLLLQNVSKLSDSL